MSRKRRRVKSEKVPRVAESVSIGATAIITRVSPVGHLSPDGAPFAGRMAETVPLPLHPGETMAKCDRGVVSRTEAMGYQWPSEGISVEVWRRDDLDALYRVLRAHPWARPACRASECAQARKRALAKDARLSLLCATVAQSKGLDAVPIRGTDDDGEDGHGASLHPYVLTVGARRRPTNAEIDALIASVRTLGGMVYFPTRGVGSNSSGHLRRDYSSIYRGGYSPAWAREAMEERDRLEGRYHVAMQIACDAERDAMRAEGDPREVNARMALARASRGRAERMMERIQALEDLCAMRWDDSAPIGEEEEGQQRLSCAFVDAPNVRRGSTAPKRRRERADGTDGGRGRFAGDFPAPPALAPTVDPSTAPWCDDAPAPRVENKEPAALAAVSAAKGASDIVGVGLHTGAGAYARSLPRWLGDVNDLLADGVTPSAEDAIAAFQRGDSPRDFVARLTT